MESTPTKPQIVATNDSSCALLVWGVDRELKAKFKAKCAERQTPIKVAIQDLMRGYIDGNPNE